MARIDPRGPRPACVTEDPGVSQVTRRTGSGGRGGRRHPRHACCAGRVQLFQPARGFRSSLDPVLLAGFVAPPYGQLPGHRLRHRGAVVPAAGPRSDGARAWGSRCSRALAALLAARGRGQQLRRPLRGDRPATSARRPSPAAVVRPGGQQPAVPAGGAGELPPDEQSAIAHHEVKLTPGRVAGPRRPSWRAPTPGWRWCCRPAALAELQAGLRANRLAPVRMRLVHPRAGAPATRVLVEARRTDGQRHAGAGAAAARARGRRLFGRGAAHAGRGRPARAARRPRRLGVTRKSLGLLARHQTGALIATAVDFLMMIAWVELRLGSSVSGAAVGAGQRGADQLHARPAAGSSRPRHRSAAGQALRYALVSAGSLGLNSLGQYLALRASALPYVLCRVMVAVAGGRVLELPPAPPLRVPRRHAATAGPASRATVGDPRCPACDRLATGAGHLVRLRLRAAGAGHRRHAGGVAAVPAAGARGTAGWWRPGGALVTLVGVWAVGAGGRRQRQTPDPADRLHRRGGRACCWCWRWPR